jgi:hypothetical protein
VTFTSDSVLGPIGRAFGWRFLHGQGTLGDATPTGRSSLMQQSGTDAISQSFSLSHGDKLDLTQLLAGAPLAADLANIGDYVKVVGYGKNDPGFGRGTKTVLEVTGPNGGATINLEGSGKLSLKDLLSHNSLILPPH